VWPTLGSRTAKDQIRSVWLWLCATIRVFLGDRDNEHFSLECVDYLSLFLNINWLFVCV